MQSSGKHILAAASIGGHWVQLLRITRLLQQRGCTVSYVSTHPKCRTMIPADARFDTVSDFSRSNAWRAPSILYRAIKLLRNINPELVITTGAAPGLMLIIAARLLKIPTVWIDSIANVERLSMCGRIASHISTLTLTQWPDLVTERVKYAGNVLGNRSV